MKRFVYLIIGFLVAEVTGIVYVNAQTNTQIPIPVFTAGSTALDVNCVSGCSSGPGSTEYTEDDASAANPAGPQIMGRRRDTLSTETTTDGDVTAVNVTGKGELYVKQTDAVPVTDNGGSLTIDGTVAATQSGTWNVGTLGTVTNVVHVDDNAGSLTVDNGGTFAVQAAQSGTWNVNNIGGTVSLPTGASTLAEQQTQTTSLQVIDDLTLAQGANTSGQSGVLAQGAVTTAAPSYTTAKTNPLSLQTDGSLRAAVTNTVTVTDGSGAMNVIVDSGTTAVTQATASNLNAQVVGAAASGASKAGNPVQIGGVYNSTQPTVTTGQAVEAQSTARGAQIVAPGVDNTASNAWFAKVTDGTSTASVKAASTAPATTDLALVVTQSPNASPICTSFVSINQTSSTSVISGSSNKYIYVCSIILVSATAQSVSISEGTGSVCATNEVAIVGGTSGSVALVANGGFSAVAAQPWLKTSVAADGLCVKQSSSGNISGVITYAQQ